MLGNSIEVLTIGSASFEVQLPKPTCIPSIVTWPAPNPGGLSFFAAESGTLGERHLRKAYRHATESNPPPAAISFNP